LDLLDASGRKLVGELAQNDSVLQDILIVSSRDGLTEHCVDPFENFLLLFLIALLRSIKFVTDDVKSFET
jgi:hypothetical protein